MTKFTVNTLAASDGTSLCKSETASYPNVYLFNSSKFECSGIKQFFDVITATAKHNMCLIKGELNKELHEESRAGATTADTPTKWICLDLDGVMLDTVEEFIALLPPVFRNTSYVLQESASLGSKPGLRYHIFMVTNELVSPTILKSILKSLNASIDILFNGTTLGRGDGNILRYPLDITTCQNDKILYVAPRSDKTARRTHIVYVDKRSKTLNISKIPFSPAADKAKLAKRKASLRKEAGLPAKKFNTRVVEGKDLITNVDEAVIDAIKEDNGFVRFNLRGSQSKSFRYYHPVDSFEYIHSFGDEETMYETSAFFPEYYKQCTNNAEVTDRNERKDHTGKEYFAVRDRNSDKYFTVVANGEDIEQLLLVSSARKAEDFCKEHGNKIDFIPTWDVACDFQTSTQWDRGAKFINMYKPSEYIRNAENTVSQPPVLIDRVIKHMLNNDQDVIDHFYNWVAVMMQYGIRTQTSWLIHGTTGTGKGLICDYVLRPLIGSQYTAKVRLSDFAGRFNEFMVDNLLLLVNEAQMSSLDERNAGAALSIIKDCITDDMVRMEGKGRAIRDVYNNCNIVFSSNQHDPIEIESNDRRTNVANRQEVSIVDVMNDEDRNDIVDGTELQAFANYIMHYEANVAQARTVIQTDALRAVQEATMDTHRALVHQITHGILDGFVMELETFDALDLNPLSGLKVDTLGEGAQTYKSIVGRMYRSSQEERPISLRRSELIVLFYALLAYVPTSVRKFSAHVNRKGAHLKNIRVNGDQTQGIGPIQFTISDEMKQQYLRYGKKHNNLRPIK